MKAEVIDMEKRRLIGIIDMLAVFMLEVMPVGVKMTFAPSAEDRIVEMRSYFSLYPFCYGHIQPLIVSMISLLLLILLICGMVFEAQEGFYRFTAILSGLAAVICFSQLPTGMGITFTGVVIILLLIAAAALSVYEIKAIRRKV